MRRLNLAKARNRPGRGGAGFSSMAAWASWSDKVAKPSKAAAASKSRAQAAGAGVWRCPCCCSQLCRALAWLVRASATKSRRCAPVHARPMRPGARAPRAAFRRRAKAGGANAPGERIRLRPPSAIRLPKAGRQCPGRSRPAPGRSLALGHGPARLVPPAPQPHGHGDVERESKWRRGPRPTQRRCGG